MRLDENGEQSLNIPQKQAFFTNQLVYFGSLQELASLRSWRFESSLGQLHHGTVSDGAVFCWPAQV